MKTCTTRIQGAENFGLFFNCLTRRYLWDYDERLLDLMYRITERYLAYFSLRTLICSIRDLANEKNSIFCECHKAKPHDQEEKYNLVLKRLVQRYLTLKLSDSPDERWKSMIIQELASDGEFAGDYGTGKDRMFPSKDSFENWARANHLDENDGMMVPKRIGETLPIKEDFRSDFFNLCLACVQYVYGRTSYMPDVCREFIGKNIALLSEEAIKRIMQAVESMVEKHQFHEDSAEHGETVAWTTFGKGLRRELTAREWQFKAQELIRHEYTQFEDEIHSMLAVVDYRTEDDYRRVWDQMDGIDRCLRENTNSYAEKKEYKRLVRWAKRFISKTAQSVWEKEHAGEFIKVGTRQYVWRNNMVGSEIRGRLLAERQIIKSQYSKEGV